MASEETSQFDIVQLVKDNIKANKEFRKTTITRLYADKRLALIKKIVLLKTNNNNEAQAIGITRTLDQCLNSYKLAFRTVIDFVVQFANYYCEHIGELDKSDASVFSKVFEASMAALPAGFSVLLTGDFAMRPFSIAMLKILRRFISNSMTRGRILPSQSNRTTTGTDGPCAHPSD